MKRQNFRGHFVGREIYPSSNFVLYQHFNTLWFDQIKENGNIHGFMITLSTLMFYIKMQFIFDSFNYSQSPALANALKLNIMFVYLNSTVNIWIFNNSNGLRRRLAKALNCNIIYINLNSNFTIEIWISNHFKWFKINAWQMHF